MLALFAGLARPHFNYMDSILIFENDLWQGCRRDKSERPVEFKTKYLEDFKIVSVWRGREEKLLFEATNCERMIFYGDSCK